MKPPIKNLNLSYYPLGDTTQFFGENPALYNQFSLDGHNGIDLVRPWGEPLYATEAGIVISTKEEVHGYGKNVRILGDAKDEKGYQNEIVYGHTAQNLCKVGDRVFAGQMIALMGNTGFTISGDTPYWKNNPYAGTHVHFGIRKAKVVKTGGFSYPNSDIKITIANYKNGYKGAVNPIDYLRKTEAPEANKRMYRQLLTIQSTINKLASLIKRK